MAKDVDYGKIIKKAKDITLNNRWLWVYGLALALFGGGGGSNGGGSGSGGGSSSNSRLNNLKTLPSDVPEKTKEVLGAATSAVKDWFFSVPVSTWILLAIVAVALIVLGIIISFVVRNWARAALISGANIAASSTIPVTLTQTAPAGRKYMKSLFLLELWVALVGLASLLAVSIPILILILIKQIVITVLLAIIGVPLLIIAMFMFAATDVYAQRLVVLHNFSPLAAWKRGFKLTKSTLVQTFVMGLINTGVGCAVGCVSTLVILILGVVPGLVIVWPVFKGGVSAVTPVMVASLIILFLVLGNISTVISAAMVVFRFSTWNLFVEEIIKDEKEL